ncbi:MAG: sigma-70 family RNA polymerase sigma factor [Actinobacteria bacterium]|nr:sigma-70 family RNA polymerase sigma factor [Actinomycetota bacterium]
MEPPLNDKTSLMRKLYIWAHSHEREVFGQTLAKSIELHSEAAMECMLQAAEAAMSSAPDLETQKRHLCRVAKSRFIDFLRHRYGTRRTREGKRVLATGENPVDMSNSAAQQLGHSPSAEDQLFAANELRRQLPDPAVIRENLRQVHGDRDCTLFAMSMENRSSIEIGETLGMTPANVRKRWERIKPALAQTLATVLGWETDRVMYFLAQPNNPRRRLRKRNKEAT